MIKIFGGLILLAMAGCGSVGKGVHSSSPTPQSPPNHDGSDPNSNPSPDPDRSSPPSPPATPKGFDLPLSAGITVVSRLSAGEPCLPVYSVTVGGMLRIADQVTDGDEVHFSYDSGTKELPLGVRFKGKLTHEFDLFPINEQQDLLASVLKAGKTLQVTRQAACATGTDSASTILVDYIDISPDTFNPSSEKVDFLNPKTPTSFGVTFGYDSKLSWQLTYTTSLAESDIAQLPDPIHYAIYDAKAMTLIVPWQKISRDAVLAGQIMIVDQVQLRRILPNQSHLELVFDTSAQDISTPTFYVSFIGEMCARQPALFKNLTQSGKSCSQMVDSDLPAF